MSEWRRIIYKTNKPNKFEAISLIYNLYILYQYIIID